MLASRVSGRWLAAALVAAGTFASSGVAMAQPASLCNGPSAVPVTATLFFQNPPPGGIFSPGTPIALVLQVRNASGASVCTTEGFSRTEFWRRLIFTAPFGTVTNAAEAVAHGETRFFHCLSRGGVLQRPTAISVVPVEVLASGFLQEYKFNAATLYNLTRPGRYAVRVQFPFITFDPTDPRQVFADCDQLAGVTVVNVGLEPGAGTTPPPPAAGRQTFTVVSNSLEFIVSQSNFVGFLSPVVNDTACPAPPCRTYRFGSTIPLRFQLFDATGAVLSNAVAHISATQISGTPPAVTPVDLGTGNADIGNVAQFDAGSGQYTFNLGTKVLAPGVWRIDVSLDDGTVHSVLVGLS